MEQLVVLYRWMCGPGDTDNTCVCVSVCLCAHRMNGEEVESSFCEHKRLNMSTLRMTWEAKVQLKDILANSGFPEGT